MTIIPDAEYQKITKFKAFYSSYKKWQKGYSGLIFYHTIDGKFTNGWRLENGKVIASITPKEDSGIDIQLNAPTADKSSTRQNVQVYGCRDYYYEIWSQDCTDWYTQSEYSSSYNGTTCGSWYIDGYQYAYTQCEYYDDGSGGNVIIPSTGGGGPSGGTSTASLGAAIAINVSTECSAQLDWILAALLQKCGYQKMYDYLVSANAKVTNVNLDPNSSHIGAYSSSSNKMVFRSITEMYSNFQEEFVHFIRTIYIQTVYHNTTIQGTPT